MLPLENLTTAQFLERSCQENSDRVAINYCGKEYTYQEFNNAVDKYARKLITLGVKNKDHVGVWCETEPHAIFVLFALEKIGAVACMLGTSLQRYGLVDLCLRSDINLLLIGKGYKDTDFIEISKNISSEVPAIREVIFIGGEWTDCEYRRLDDIKLASEKELEDAKSLVKPEDTSLILYTSGTTSAPKCVMTSHYSRVNSAIQQAKDIGATKDDVFLVSMPIFHCFCLTVNIFASIAVGAKMYIPSSRRTLDLLTAISYGKCTIFSCVPALFDAVISRPDFAKWDVSSLRAGYIGGSACARPLFFDIENKLGITLISSLGQTEATAGLTTTTFNDPPELRAESVGHFMDHVQGKIVSLQTGEEVPLGTPGEIVIKGYNVMQGYYGNEVETNKALTVDGWLHTGDMGYLDGDGNLHLTGRTKELIIRGGENISPAEIEGVMYRDPVVKECKAVGVPDKHYGEEVCLCVILDRSGVRTEEEIRNRLLKNIAYYKVPKYILFFDEFPQTSTGKIQTGELKKIVNERLGIE
ncbi:MAG: AMP-binding protein [Bacillota bacterium]|nr:AMP-binding protein [Bacillota bacterium]